MGESGLRYDRMVERALRGVMRDALSHVAKHGLPGAHHFYLTFRTTHSGVRMDDTLKARFPEEMTIVLQHQFWDLTVEDTGFAVTLSFSNVPQRLNVPFSAVTTFNDPSVNFALQFQAIAEAAGAKAPAAAAAPAKPPAATAKSGTPKPGTVTPLPKPTPPVPADAPPGEKVVTLDSFRKK
jgi:uncharacterized protein